ncbi:MAG: hypothetical protein KGJ64_03480, partial [Betaproteobacteria bacterium]|nr:hypothetical protein [Betaproteobacteria bacterium]
ALALQAGIAAPACAAASAPAGATSGPHSAIPRTARLQLRLPDSGAASPLAGPVVLDDLRVQDARADAQGGQVTLWLHLNADASRRFAELTRAYVGRRLAVVVVEPHRTLLLAAPVIQTEIAGGQLQIVLHMPLSEARDLARRLRAPSPAPETGQASHATRPGSSGGRPGSP